MLKTIVLHGSPNKNMNSDTLTEHFLNGIRKSGDQEVKHFYTNELDIRACQGCLHCETSENHECVIQDDMQEIYSAYIAADIIVFATPMYWGYMTAQLKTVFDRMEALAWKGFSDKTFAVFITYRHHYESTKAFFERICPHFNVELHVLTCCTMDLETRKDIPISDRQDKLIEAFELGKKLGTTPRQSAHN
ncbi:MAG: flavodoxin family protein [Anaerolineaceae bacterium]|nr:flavodoxin family protein [Anaerolineaceae bacterium]